MMTPVNEKPTDRYDEIGWFDASDLANIRSIVKRSSESAEVIERNMGSIRIRGRGGREIFSRMFMLADDCYSLMCEWLKIQPGNYVLCLTTVTPSEDIFGAEMKIEEGGGVAKDGERVVLINFKVENFRERDEKGGDPVTFVASIMSRIVYLMLYHDIEMMRKEVLEKSHATLPIIKEVLEKMALESIRDMEKWI